MREIKFRGKRKDNSEWAYGYYLPWHSVKDMTGEDVYAQIFEEKDEKHPKGWANVIASTVGQFTGLYDKNGKEIYEGDIVATKLNDKIISVGDIQFHCGVFGAEWRHAKKDKTMVGSWRQRHNLRRLDDDIIDDIEVIGNIYDNPKLIKE